MLQTDSTSRRSFTMPSPELMDKSIKKIYQRKGRGVTLKIIDHRTHEEILTFQCLAYGSLDEIHLTYQDARKFLDMLKTAVEAHQKWRKENRGWGNKVPGIIADVLRARENSDGDKTGEVSDPVQTTTEGNGEG